jgi:hypothetical protein
MRRQKTRPIYVIKTWYFVINTEFMKHAASPTLIVLTFS